MNIYNSIYDLLNTYVFGGSITANSVQDLAVTLVSLTACIFLVSIPFLIVWKVIKMLGGV